MYRKSNIFKMWTILVILAFTLNNISYAAPIDKQTLRVPATATTGPRITDIFPGKQSSAGTVPDSGMDRRSFLKQTAAAAAALLTADPVSLLGQASSDEVRRFVTAANTGMRNFFTLNSATVDTSLGKMTLPLSFYTAPADRKKVLADIAATSSDSTQAAIEARMVMRMVNIYDASCAIILNARSGWNSTYGKDLAQAVRDGYWGLMKLWSDDTGYFRLGRELAFLFRSTDGYGEWEAEDPLAPGQVRQWQDWKPIAGENAWAVKALSRTHYYEYGKVRRKSLELEQAERIAANAIKMQEYQPSVGGVRFAPPGTYHDATGDTEFMWKEISTENNISWYGAFRDLYEITGNIKYKRAMERIENEYLPAVAEFDPAAGDCYFHQGMHYYPGKGWVPNKTDFATDCQTWAISCLGPEKINEIFNKKYGKVKEYGNKVGTKGAAFQVWKTTVDKAGQTINGTLIGLAYTENQDVVSVEWTAGGINTALVLSYFYRNTLWEKQLFDEAVSMCIHLETMKRVLPNGSIAYPYASKRVKIPFGWNAPPKEVLSTTSTSWMGFLYNGIDSWRLDGKIPRADELLAALVGAIEQGRTKTVPEEKAEPAVEQKSGVPDSGKTLNIVSSKTIIPSPTGYWPQNMQGVAFSCYADGKFDLSDATHIRVVFPEHQAGTNIVVRLLPKGGSADSSTGASLTSMAIPRDGIVTIALSEFPLSRSMLRDIIQVSVHSGAEAWGTPLEQPANKRTRFSRVDKLTAKQSSAGAVPDKALDRRNFIKKAMVVTGETGLLGALVGCESVPSSTISISSSETIITGPTGTWSGAGAFSCYADGEFDLSNATHIRFVFPAAQAGTKFVARLLPEGGNPNLATGSSLYVYAVAEDGSASIALDQFSLHENELRNLKQISVHSGADAWGTLLKQPADKHAIFIRVDKLRAKSSSAGAVPEDVYNRRDLYRKAVESAAKAGVFGSLLSSLLSLSCAPTAKRETSTVATGQQQPEAATEQPQAQAMPAPVVSKSTSILESAFDALNAKKYAEAIRITEEAIASHPEWLTAAREQAEYVDKMLKRDPNWLTKVTSPETARAISSGETPNTYTEKCGSLHDLGGLYYIIFMASYYLFSQTESEQEKAKHRRRAVDAAKVLLKEFQHSWMWDPRGPWFWSITEHGLKRDAERGRYEGFKEIYEQAIKELEQGKYTSPIAAAIVTLDLLSKTDAEKSDIHKSSAAGVLEVANQQYNQAVEQLNRSGIAENPVEALESLKQVFRSAAASYREVTAVQEIAEAKLKRQMATDIANTIEGIVSHGIRLQEYEGLRPDFEGKKVLEEQRKTVPWLLDKTSVLGKQIDIAQKVGELTEIEKRIGAKAILCNPEEDDIKQVLVASGFEANTPAIAVSSAKNESKFRKANVKVLTLDNFSEDQYIDLSLLAVYSKALLYLDLLRSETQITGKLNSLVINLHQSITGVKATNDDIETFLREGIMQLVYSLPKPDVRYRDGELENLHMQVTALLKAA